MLPLLALNAMDPSEARAEFLKCCAASRWADQMVARRPFASTGQVLDASDEIWAQMRTKDYLEAFAGHPRIGDLDSLRARYGDTRTWAQGEQAGAQGASELVLEGLAEGNRAYEERFGHLFIVCATGKSAAEMLEILRSRLGNDPEIETHVAAAEQHKITRIRLEKLLTP